MRLSALARGALVFSTFLLASSCDWPGVSGSSATGSLGIAIPRFAGDNAIAAQTSPTELQFNFRVRITVVRTGEVIHNERYTQRDVQLNTDPSSSTVGTLPVQFKLPSNAEGETYSIELEVEDLLGNRVFTVGPLTFTLGPDGRSATVTGDLNYVGPGSTADRVELQPRSLSLSVGATGQVACNGYAGISTTPVGAFLHSLTSETPSVATVNSAGVVTAVSPGTTRIVCRLEFGNRATDNITVTVTGGAVTPANLTLVSGGNQTGPAGAALPLPIRVRVTSANQQNVSGVLVRFTVSGGAGSVNASDVTTAADGTAEVIWTLGPVTGLQTLAVVVVGQSGLNLIVNATATAAAQTGGIQANIRNAATGAAVSGASVQLRAGTSPTGTVQTAVSSNASGVALFSALSPGTYNLTIQASGFASNNVVVNVSAGQTATVNVALSSSLSAGQVRIVLTWSDNTLDLDARLTLPNGDIVRWNNHNVQLGCSLSAPPFACLEHDAIQGDPPIEAIQISQIGSGTYTFVVYNFSADNGNGATLQSLSQSGARVQVYIGSSSTPANTFTVPAQTGNHWTVFTLTGQTVTPVNTVGTTNIPVGSIRAGAAGSKQD